jgi:hypothetical protein
VSDSRIGVARRRAWWSLVCAGLGGWFVASVLSQHPQRMFDRLRYHDPTGTLLPDWRFFAPEPAQYDFVLLRRELDASGVETPWQVVLDGIPRAWRHSLWFPRRRLDKGVHDACDQIARHLNLLGDDGTSAPAYALMRGLVEQSVAGEYQGRPPPRGFQFLIGRFAGHDRSEKPQYIYLSRFEKL